MVTKLDGAWQKLFDKYNIYEAVEKDGYYIITADQIREFREPRLMTKFDHNEDLPIIFKEAKLSIMPVSRNKYRISNNEMFSELKETTFEVDSFPLPEYIESITPDSITSEAIALNCPYLTGMIADFIGDDDIYPTVSGKMSSKTFSFNIENVLTKRLDKIDVENSMIEIDGAYEGTKYLTIVEAKQTLADNFLIRQLYYPFRVWKNRVVKDIKLVYFVYSNSVFHFFEYIFEDEQNYNSIRLVKQKNYTLEDLTITTQDILDILNTVKILDEPEIPFPQADSFNRVINMCEYFSSGEKEKQDITVEYSFTGRQTDYYTNAGRYIGLFENDRGHVNLSQIGKNILKLDYKKRQLKYVELILSHKIFNWALNERFATGELLRKQQLVEEMKKCNLYHIDSVETYKRRASTIISWIEWIIALIQE